jgi:hypothetical protein
VEYHLHLYGTRTLLRTYVLLPVEGSCFFALDYNPDTCKQCVTITLQLSLCLSPRARVDGCGTVISWGFVPRLSLPVTSTSSFTLNYGRTAIHYRIRSPLARRTDSSPDCRFARPREDPRIASSRTVPPMDGCQNHGCISRRLQEEDPR